MCIRKERGSVTSEDILNYRVSIPIKDLASSEHMPAIDTKSNAGFKKYWLSYGVRPIPLRDLAKYKGAWNYNALRKIALINSMIFSENFGNDSHKEWVIYPTLENVGHLFKDKSTYDYERFFKEIKEWKFEYPFRIYNLLGLFKEPETYNNKKVLRARLRKAVEDGAIKIINSTHFPPSNYTHIYYIITEHNSHILIPKHLDRKRDEDISQFNKRLREHYHEKIVAWTPT